MRQSGSRHRLSGWHSRPCCSILATAPCSRCHTKPLVQPLCEVWVKKQLTPERGRSISTPKQCTTGAYSCVTVNFEMIVINECQQGCTALMTCHAQVWHLIPLHQGSIGKMLSSAKATLDPHQEVCHNKHLHRGCQTMQCKMHEKRKSCIYYMYRRWRVTLFSN